MIVKGVVQPDRTFCVKQALVLFFQTAGPNRFHRKAGLCVACLEVYFNIFLNRLLVYKPSNKMYPTGVLGVFELEST